MTASTATTQKFCTLQEAAERLDTTPEKIEMLLRRGVLHEFRDGPHRLLRTIEVGALVAARIRRLERQGQPMAQNEAAPADCPQDRKSDSGRPREVRVPRSSAPSPRGVRPKTVRGNHLSVPRSSPSRSPGRSRTSKKRARPAAAQRPSQSVREWFWTGLTQDRPTAIALLSGLILLGLAAVVGGICTLADTLR